MTTDDDATLPLGSTLTLVFSAPPAPLPSILKHPSTTDSASVTVAFAPLPITGRPKKHTRLGVASRSALLRPAHHSGPYANNDYYTNPLAQYGLDEHGNPLDEDEDGGYYYPRRKGVLEEESEALDAIGQMMADAGRSLWNKVLKVGKGARSRDNLRQDSLSDDDEKDKSPTVPKVTKTVVVKPIPPVTTTTSAGGSGPLRLDRKITPPRPVPSPKSVPSTPNPQPSLREKELRVDRVVQYALKEDNEDSDEYASPYEDYSSLLAASGISVPVTVNGNAPPEADISQLGAVQIELGGIKTSEVGKSLINTVKKGHAHSNSITSASTATARPSSAKPSTNSNPAPAPTRPKSFTAPPKSNPSTLTRNSTSDAPPPSTNTTTTTTPPDIDRKRTSSSPNPTPLARSNTKKSIPNLRGTFMFGKKEKEKTKTNTPPMPPPPLPPTTPAKSKS